LPKWCSASWRQEMAALVRVETGISWSPIEVRVRGLGGEVRWRWGSRPLGLMHCLCQGCAGGAQVLNGAAVVLSLAAGPGRVSAAGSSRAGGEHAGASTAGGEHGQGEHSRGEHCPGRG
jgi:hypothetical protein